MRLPHQHASLASRHAVGGILPLERHNEGLAVTPRLNLYRGAFWPDGKILDCVERQALNLHPVDSLNHVAYLETTATLRSEARDDALDDGRVILQFNINPHGQPRKNLNFPWILAVFKILSIFNVIGLIDTTQNDVYNDECGLAGE